MANTLRFLWVSVLLWNPVLSQFDEFFYDGFAGAGNNMSLNGVAKIEKNGILRLTNETIRVIGHAFYESPLQFKNYANGRVFSFSTTFAFAIDSESPKHGGHGFAFAISPTKELRGALHSDYLGLLNQSNIGNFSNHIFAVEFDTAETSEFGDINANHIGIDINDLTSKASVSASYFGDDGMKHDINLKSGKTIQAWIDYDSVRHLLNVTLSPSSSKPSFPILSLDLDLSPVLHKSMYVGFSASTGLVTSSHYIFGWSFKMNGAAPTLDLSSLPSILRPRKKPTALTIGFSVSAAVIIVSAISIVIYLFWKMRNAEEIEEWELHIGPHRFPYEELRVATKGFSEKELLGFGGCGRVFRGKLPNSKTQVAVKRFSDESKRGLREFLSEIATIGRLRHRNLVQLEGWCRRWGDLLLVYDFMPNGSLDKLLFHESKSILSWKQRFKIIKGVASGLLYLHEGWEQIVIHRDIKASNVLLDGELNGRLGDFGLAKSYEHGSSPCTTRVVGTMGYLAPELTRTGKATTSSDVFAFGALLLETTCGRRPIEPKASPEELILVDWVWERWREGRILEVVDPKLKGDYDEAEVVVVVKLGLMCSSNSPGARPSMRQVVRYLEGEATVPEVLNAPEELEAGMSEVGFDDFVHSYPSSSFETGSS